METDNKPFWLVWNPTGSNPRYRHDSESAAIHEAERLAKLNPTEQFFVVRAIACSQFRPVDTVRLGGTEYCPFDN